MCSLIAEDKMNRETNSSARDILRDITPPILWNAMKAMVTRPLVEYPSREAAMAAAGTYSDTLVNEFRVAREDINRNRNYDVEILHLPLIWMVKTLGGVASITDFGGATGEIGRALRNAFPSVQYTVVENPTMVALMTPKDPSITFDTSLPNECDIFFTSSTLQYLPDPYGMLDQGLRSARYAALLARNSFSESPIFRVQRSRLFENGRGTIPPGFQNIEISYPHQTIQEKRVLEIADRAGFMLVSRNLRNDGIFPHRNLVYGAELAFLRK
jgi:putative methyltransferase (TIGR04325 family)